LQQQVNEVDMEISGASSSAYNSGYDRPAVAARNADDGDVVVSRTEWIAVPQDTVDISPEAAQRAYASDDADADDEDDAPSVDNETTAATNEAASVTAANSANEVKADSADNADGKKDISSSKSFLYGALGLERPEKTEDKPADGYQMGRWLAAGVTIGTIISVLV